MAIDRRRFVTIGGAALGAGLGAGVPLPRANARAVARIATPRAGALDAAHFGLHLGAGEDQGAALQAAVDAAVERGLPLFVPPGRYLVSGVALPTGAYLAGVPGATRLLFAGGAHMFYAHGARHITLAGLTLAGAGNAFTAGAPGLVHLRLVRRLAIEDCVIAETDRSGVVLEYCDGHVSGCEISGCGDAGLFSLDAAGLEIAGNHVHGCGDDAIRVWRSKKGEDGTLIAHNRIADIGPRAGAGRARGNGVAVLQAGSVVIANNRVTGCASSAVHCRSASNSQILGNSCTRLGGVALRIERAFEGAIVADNVVDGAATGISVTNFDEGGRLAVVTGNVVRNIGRTTGSGAADGTGIAVEADTVVGNNVIEGIAATGVALGWGEALRDVSATGNVIRDAAIGLTVSVAPGAGTALISDNLISRTRRGAIFGTKRAEVVTGDLATDGAAAYPRLRIERNHTS